MNESGRADNSGEQIQPNASSDFGTAYTTFEPPSSGDFPYGLRRIHDKSTQQRLTDNTGGGDARRTDLPPGVGWGVIRTSHLSRNRPAASTSEPRGAPRRAKHRHDAAQFNAMNQIGGRNYIGAVETSNPLESGDVLRDFDFDSFLRGDDVDNQFLDSTTR